VELDEQQRLQLLDLERQSREREAGRTQPDEPDDRHGRPTTERGQYARLPARTAKQGARRSREP
jgi:hypothetical protein